MNKNTFRLYRNKSEILNCILNGQTSQAAGFVSL